MFQDQGKSPFRYDTDDEEFLDQQGFFDGGNSKSPKNTNFIHPNAVREF